jgi:hypothetical protein
MRALYILLLFFLIVPGCKKNTPGNDTLGFDGIKEREIEITGKAVIEGFPLGTDFDRGEVYVDYLLKTRKYLVKIANIETGKLAKTMELEYGPMESPTKVYNPNYMQYLNHRYVIIDQYEKILVFDEQLKYLFTNMFNVHRYFIDFYIKDNQTFLVIGEIFYGMKNRKNTIKIFQFYDNKRPEFVKKLACFSNKSLSIKNRQSKKYSYKGFFWPSGRGFEKNGKIYYSSGIENKYYSHDLGTGETRVIDLSYLKHREFSNTDATKLGLYTSNGWEEIFFRKTGKKVIYEAYPEPLYHFGIYDVGHNKVGVVGDIELETYKFRLDIIDISTDKYIESIWLPSGAGFIDNISTSSRGVMQIYINVDKGIYVWHDEVGEDFIDSVMITKFKIKRKTEPGSREKNENI